VVIFIMLGGHAVYTAFIIGSIKTLSSATCDRVTVLEVAVAKLPERFTSLQAHEDFKEKVAMLTAKRDASEKDLKETLVRSTDELKTDIRDLSRKVDAHMEQTRRKRD
jgi:hypothetical protein